jgi:adenosylmethionine---8-amino-7-oxononanoate aminotransferase
MIHDNIWPPYWIMKDQTERLHITKTKGSFIFDQNNTKIFDGISSWWAVCHGYNHPKIVASMKQCLETMPHVMFAGITHEYAHILAETLSEFSFNRFTRVFFCDSGSVAVEVAIKMGLQYWCEMGNVEKTHILTFTGCYHGETFMASALSSDESSHIGSYVNNVVNVKLPKNKEEIAEFTSFVEKNHKKIACSIIEPLMQGAAGIKLYDAEILAIIYRILKKHNILFIADECATGFYRTGRRFAFDHAEILPDIITIGKALTGGHISLAGVLTTEEIFKTICSDGYFRHGPTFMANPLACSAAIASLQVFNEMNYPEHIKKIEGVFLDLKIKLCKSLGLNARILGAIFAVDIIPNCNVRAYILQNISTLKLWVRPIHNTLYLMPPLNVEMEDLLSAIKSFERIVKNTHSVL